MTPDDDLAGRLLVPTDADAAWRELLTCVMHSASMMHMTNTEQRPSRMICKTCGYNVYRNLLPTGEYSDTYRHPSCYHSICSWLIPIPAK